MSCQQRTVPPRRIAVVSLWTLLLPAVSAASARAAVVDPGTLRAVMGGDRVPGVTDNRAYAAPLSGARFEYTSDAAKAADPASAGWTAFPPATEADGTASASVAQGTWYVRRRSAAPGSG